MGRARIHDVALVFLSLTLCSCQANTAPAPPPQGVAEGRELPESVSSFRAGSLAAGAAVTDDRARALLGPPDFELTAASGTSADRALLGRLGAETSLHYFHPEYATVSLAIGLVGDRVAGTALVSLTNPTAPCLAEVAEFWAAEDARRPIDWDVAR